MCLIRWSKSRPILSMLNSCFCAVFCAALYHKANILTVHNVLLSLKAVFLQNMPLYLISLHLSDEQCKPNLLFIA